MKYNEVCLADVCDLIAGYAFKSKDFGDFDDKVIKITHITPPIVDMNGLSGVDFSKYNREKLKRYIAKSGDYVLAMTGATIGKIGRIVSGEAYINQRVLLFKNKDAIDKDFLYYVLLQHDFEQYVYNHIDSESAQPNISATTIGKYIFSLPPMSIQQKIGRLLRSLDEKCEVNNAINHNLQQQAQAIFQSWFVDFSHWGNTPPDWEQGVFSDYVTVKRGGSPRPIQDYLSAIGYRWLKISDVTSLQTPYITTIAEHIKESGIGKTVFLKSGSLVLSNSATPGIPKILDVDSCIHDGWLYFPQSEFSNEFLLLFFLQIRPKLVALGNGSVFTNLKTDILKSYPISKPPKEVLEEFDNIVKPLFSTILLNTRQNNHLICVRDSLLPKLMSGEIDVSQVEV